MIKVLIVDDSAVVRNTFESIINEEPGMEVLGTASDPYIAAKKLQTAVPDVVVLDIEMPRMDGLSFLRKIMKQHPIPVIICSSKTEEGSANAFNALKFGAVEIIQKPKMGTREFLLESKILLCDVIRAASTVDVKKINVDAGIRIPSKKLSADVMLQRPTQTLGIDTTEKIVAIGASTGGTEALRFIFESLPIDAPGIIVVQHMPENFTRTFAERLNETCKVTVKEAKHNDSVLRGTVLIAPGNKHMMLHRRGARYSVQVKEGPLVSRHRPSVDVLFRSAARYGGKNIVGVMLTGMGDDGANGMKEMKDNGAYNIIQDEKSCVVFGMPKEAIKRGADSTIVPLDKVPEVIMKAATV